MVPFLILNRFFGIPAGKAANITIKYLMFMFAIGIILGLLFLAVVIALGIDLEGFRNQEG